MCTFARSLVGSLTQTNSSTDHFQYRTQFSVILERYCMRRNDTTSEMYHVILAHHLWCYRIGLPILCLPPLAFGRVIANS